MDKNKIYQLKNNEVIMEHLTGGYESIETIKSEGLYLYGGEMGKMKPIKPLTTHEAEEMIKKVGLKCVM